MWMGEFPGRDPYGCQDECGFLPMFPSHYHGAVCNWLRRFGKPYYGWRWYRDMNASVGTVGPIVVGKVGNVVPVPSPV